jgi:hypothetical protein
MAKKSCFEIDSLESLKHWSMITTSISFKMSQETSATVVTINLWKKQFSQLNNKQKMALLRALTNFQCYYSSCTQVKLPPLLFKKQHSSSSPCCSKARATYK